MYAVGDPNYDRTAAGREAGEDAIETIWALSTPVLLTSTHWLFNALGWSPGRHGYGVRLVTDEGRAPGVRRGLVRTAGAVVSAAPLGLGFLWAAWDGEKRTWHDKLAGNLRHQGESPGSRERGLGSRTPRRPPR